MKTDRKELIERLKATATWLDEQAAYAHARSTHEDISAAGQASWKVHAECRSLYASAVQDAISALGEEAAGPLAIADQIVQGLIRSRRPHGYVIATVLPMDRLLEAFLGARDDKFVPTRPEFFALSAKKSPTREELAKTIDPEAFEAEAGRAREGYPPGVYTSNRTAAAELAADRVLSLFQPHGSGEWRPTHQHVKRGTDYQVIGEAWFQNAGVIGSMDDEPVTIYRGKDGRLWVRPTAEFGDGRFAPLMVTPEWVARKAAEEDGLEVGAGFELVPSPPAEGEGR